MYQYYIYQLHTFALVCMQDTLYTMYRIYIITCRTVWFPVNYEDNYTSHACSFFSNFQCSYIMHAHNTCMHEGT